MYELGDENNFDFDMEQVRKLEAKFNKSSAEELKEMGFGVSMRRELTAMEEGKEMLYKKQSKLFYSMWGGFWVGLAIQLFLISWHKVSFTMAQHVIICIFYVTWFLLLGREIERIRKRLARLGDKSLLYWNVLTEKGL